MRRRVRCGVFSLAGVALLAFSRSAVAVDGLAVAYAGDANGLSVGSVRVSAQWDWDRRWLEHGNWHLDGYWDLGLAHWENDGGERTNSGLWDLSVTPAVRWRQIRPTALAPYLEAGLGAHLLSQTSVNAARRLGSALQFATHLGIGLRFGPRHEYDVSCRVMHLSNAGIHEPNDGIEFTELRLGYRF